MQLEVVRAYGSRGSTKQFKQLILFCVSKDGLFTFTGEFNNGVDTRLYNTTRCCMTRRDNQDTTEQTTRPHIPGEKPPYFYCPIT